MTEESLLILNMLREGKISAEQADSLLRAVRSAPQQPPPPRSRESKPGIDPAALASQAARAAGQAASFAGKVVDQLGKPAIDFAAINKTVDEAVRSLNSFKTDAIRTAKVAARQAANEARRAARRGSRNGNFDFGAYFGTSGTLRPENAENLPEEGETGTTEVSWLGATSIVLSNSYGGTTLTGQDGPADGVATVVRRAWAPTQDEARVLLQQIFLTSRVENGRCRIEVVAPKDAAGRTIVDFAMAIPNNLPVEIATTFGPIDAIGISGAVTVESDSGDIALRQPAEATGDAIIRSSSGRIGLEAWNTAAVQVKIASGSGDVSVRQVTGLSIEGESRTGDLHVERAQTVKGGELHTVSGDIVITDSALSARATLRTQSGRITARRVKSADIQTDTVSGDTILAEISGPVTARTISGDISAEGMESQTASINLVSGDAVWEYANGAAGTLNGTNVSGDLRVTVGPQASVRVDMSTTSGRIECAADLSEKVEVGRQKVSGKMGEGAGAIRLQSISGDIAIITRAEEAPEKPEAQPRRRRKPNESA